MSSFIDYIQSFTPLDQSLVTQLALIIHQESFFSGEFLLRPGRILSRIYFLKKGLAKAFAYQSGGRVEVHQFFQEGTLLWDAQSFLSRHPSKVYIQLLENCQLESIESSALHTLLQQSSQARKCANLVLADCLQQRDLRGSFNSLPLQKSYAAFCLQFPCHRLPVQDIASYLGVRATTLSRLRGNRS